MKKRKWAFLLVFVLTLSLLSIIAGQTTQAVPNGGYARPGILIQPEELKALIEKKDPGIRIIDIREKVKYLSGHVPGAVHVWRPDIVDKNHRLPGMMAPQTQIEEFLGSIGISDRNTIVIYSDGPDNGRLWWILVYYGFPLHQMKLLDGGIDGWKTKGYPTETSEPRVEKVRFKFQERAKEREPLLCNLREVKEALKNPKKVVLDVRSKKEYLGEETLPGAVKPGRIPGVAYIEWKEVLVKEGPYKGYWKSSDEIKKLFFDIKVTPDKDIHIY